ncbi:hypothetical protein JCM8547_008554 [Rhodosporidiobolus lusitaniae]
MTPQDELNPLRIAGASPSRSLKGCSPAASSPCFLRPTFLPLNGLDPDHPTSDDPPVALTAKRVHLVAGSAVFADMLEVGTASSKSNSSVSLVETSAELAPFLALLAGVSKAVDTLHDHKLWEKLAKLGDKYDSPVVRLVCELRLVKLGASSPGHAFVPATYIGKKSLIQEKAFKVVSLGDAEQASLRCSLAWKTQLRIYKESLRNHALRVFATFDVILARCDDEDDTCRTDYVVETWHAVSRRLVTEFNPANPFTAGTKIHCKVCEACAKGIRHAAKQIEEKYLSSLPEFPGCKAPLGR